MMRIVQHRRQPVQLGIAETFRLDRFNRRQNIVAVDAVPMPTFLIGT
ncbi:hypothetical protein V1283_008658 [Bradyrhizobium sp. AZCC 2262]|jgi:hypothetical protein